VLRVRVPQAFDARSPDEDERLSSIAFGVGCFHFAPAAESHFETLGGYVAALKEVLEGLEFVADTVLVSYDDAYEDQPIGVVQADLQHGEEPYPNVPSGRLMFRVDLPKDQADAVLGDMHVRVPGTRFLVEIIYGYWMPVALVYTLDLEDGADHPSNAVIVIREALSRALSEGEFDFQCLGPSPFHGDFFLSPVSGLDHGDKFALSVTETRGYDRYDFLFDAREFDTASNAYIDLSESLGEELDFYYRVVAGRARQIRASMELDVQVFDAISLYRGRRFRDRVRRIFRGARAIDGAAVALAEYEGTEIREASALQRELTDVYAKDEPAFIREFVEEEINAGTKYPSDPARAMVSLFEARRLSSREATALIVAAVLGGQYDRTGNNDSAAGRNRARSHVCDPPSVIAIQQVSCSWIALAQSSGGPGLRNCERREHSRCLDRSLAQQQEAASPLTVLSCVSRVEGAAYDIERNHQRMESHGRGLEPKAAVERCGSIIECVHGDCAYGELVGGA
jgi:hypothetical protein